MSYTSEVLADTPVGYWRLGDQSGTTASDSSGNARNGTYTGGFTLQAGGLIAEDSNDAVSFNGTTGYVDLGTNIFGPVLNGSARVTIEAWFIPNSASGTQWFLFIPINVAANVGVGIGLSGTGIRGQARSVTGDLTQTATATSLAVIGKPVYVACVFDFSAAPSGKRIKVYINGRLETNTAVTFANATYTNGTPDNQDSIGAGNSGTTQNEFFNGIIDEVAIYTTELSATRILAHWDAGSIKITKNLFYRQILDVFAATANPTTSINKTINYSRPLPVWGYDTTSTNPKIVEVAVNGSISGTVKVNGVAIADRFVRLYYRKHGNLIGSIKTGSTGTFSFINLDPADKYFVIAFDDINMVPDYNAKVFDILSPTI
ncbi:MAG: LamG domain-containing protein [Nitrosopumilaceae archaeon]